MKRTLFIFAILILLAAAAHAGGKHNGIESYIETHHPAAKHVQMHETSEGITMVLFTDNDLIYKIGFDQYDKPCCSEVQMKAKDLPLTIQANLPSGVQPEYISYNATATKHFYAVEYKVGNQKIKRLFKEDGTEIHQ